MKRRHTGRLRWPGSGRRSDDHREADRLAPLEETAAFKDSPQRDGNPSAVRDTIRIDNTTVRMPEHLTEEEREGGSIFRLEPVVVFLIAAIILFIAFVSWQITLMPEK